MGVAEKMFTNSKQGQLKHEHVVASMSKLLLNNGYQDTTKAQKIINEEIKKNIELVNQVTKGGN